MTDARDPSTPTAPPRPDPTRLRNWAGMKDFSEAEHSVVNEDYARVVNERNGLAREMLAVLEERDEALAALRDEIEWLDEEAKWEMEKERARSVRQGNAPSTDEMVHFLLRKVKLAERLAVIDGGTSERSVRLEDVIKQRDAAVKIAEEAVKQITLVALGDQSSMSRTWLAPAHSVQLHRAIEVFHAQLKEIKVDPLPGLGQPERVAELRDAAVAIAREAMKLIAGILSSSVDPKSGTMLEPNDRARLHNAMAELRVQLAKIGVDAPQLEPSPVVGQAEPRSIRR